MQGNGTKTHFRPTMTLGTFSFTLIDTHNEATEP